MQLMDVNVCSLICISAFSFRTGFVVCLLQCFGSEDVDIYN